MIKTRLLLPESLATVYEKVQPFIPDNYKSLTAFAQLFMQKDTMFIELGDFYGCVWFTNLIPGWRAEVHCVLWDDKARGRATEAVAVLKYYRDFLRLRRLAAYIPDLPEYIPALKYAEKIGFHYEGLLKNADRYGGIVINVHSLVLTEEE